MGQSAILDQVLAHYGTVCACCGTTERLSIDHVNGDGQAHRLEIFGPGNHGGVRFWRWLIAHGFPEGYQTMCRRCNQSKGTGPTCRLWHGDPRFWRCTGRCGQVKDLGQFGPHLRNRNGHQSRCRECEAAHKRALRAADR